MSVLLRIYRWLAGDLVAARPTIRGGQYRTRRGVAFLFLPQTAAGCGRRHGLRKSVPFDFEWMACFLIVRRVDAALGWSMVRRATRRVSLASSWHFAIHVGI